jgi:membrane protease YdiL (CAAX protease family)
MNSFSHNTIAHKNYIIFGSLGAVVLLYIIEQIIGVSYEIKTLAKILLFVAVPYVYIIVFKKHTSKQTVNINRADKRNLLTGAFFGITCFLIIITAYYLLRDIINLQGIVDELTVKSKITPVNFMFVGLYITFGNSLLEEFFFRGFIFLNLYEIKSKRVAYLYSALLFGFYHISIFKTWFNMWLMVLALAGLVSVGFVFNWLDAKSGNFLNSWIVHILADIAIILIGLKMFNVI